MRLSQRIPWILILRNPGEGLRICPDSRQVKYAGIVGLVGYFRLNVVLAIGHGLDY